MKEEYQSPGEVSYRANPNFITREVAGELLVIPAGEQTQKLNGLITFSESGAFLWTQLQQGCTKAELVRRLSGEYNQDSEDIRADVDSFIEKAVARELVVAC